MTENLAGRGEGLAELRERIVAAIKRAWPKTKVSSYNGVISELEKLCREIALEAAAPAGTAQLESEVAYVREFIQWAIAEISTDEAAACAEQATDAFDNILAALATPSPQAPKSVEWFKERMREQVAFDDAQSNAFSTTSVREQSSATASDSPSMGYPHNLPATRQEVSELRKLFDWHLSDLRKTIQAEHYYMKEWLKPYVPAATQEQPAGSKRCDECEWHGCAGREHGCGCKCHIMEMIAGQAKLEGVAPGSPRKVGEDGALTETQVEDIHKIIERHSTDVIDYELAADDINAYLSRSSSVPVGEQKQEEGASSEIREALEQVATYLETQSIEHSPDCSYGATHGPHGDFCDCGLKARKGKRLEVYAVIQAALAPSRQGAAKRVEG